jgi:glutathione S-transferase
MNSPASPRTASIRLYRHPLSGHCHRIELMLSLLDLPVEFVNIDLLAGEQKRPGFLALNAFGQVPVIQDGGVTLADSNAILVYLAAKYGNGQWTPADAVEAAAMQRWLSAAAGPLAYGPSAARVIQLFNKPDNPADAIARAHVLLAVMEQQLAATPFLAGGKPTLADIANYSYVAHAPEGNVSLAAYPQVRAWLARVEALPKFVPMARTPIGLAA